MDNLGGFNFEPTEYVDITDEIETKLKMLSCHQSQLMWMMDHDKVDFTETVMGEGGKPSRVYRTVQGGNIGLDGNGGELYRYHNGGRTRQGNKPQPEVQTQRIRQARRLRHGHMGNPAIPGMKSRRVKIGDGYFNNYITATMSLQDVEFKSACTGNYITSYGISNCTFGNSFSSNYLGAGPALPTGGTTFGDSCSSNYFNFAGYSTFGNYVRNISAGLIQYCTFDSYAGYLVLLLNNMTSISYSVFRARTSTTLTFGANALVTRGYSVEYYVPSDNTSGYRGKYTSSSGASTVFDATA